MKHLRSPWILLAVWIILFGILRIAEHTFSIQDYIQDYDLYEPVVLFITAILFPIIAFKKQWKILPLIEATVWVALPLFFIAADTVIDMDLGRYIFIQAATSLAFVPVMFAWLALTSIILLLGKEDRKLVLLNIAACIVLGALVWYAGMLRMY